MNRKTYQARAISRTAPPVDVDDLIREMDRKTRKLAPPPIAAEDARTVLEHWRDSQKLAEFHSNYPFGEGSNNAHATLRAVQKLMPSSEHTHWTAGQMRVWLEFWCEKAGVR